MQTNEKNRTGSRRLRQRGAEVIEFTLSLLPFLCVMFVTMDIAWGIFIKSTLQYAAHSGMRYGITITGTEAEAAGSTLTAMVRAQVQATSLGMLAGSNGLNYIHVNFWGINAAGNLVSMDGVGGGDECPNLMVVSIDNYPLPALAPRIFSWNAAPDNNATTISVASADEVEPSGDVPTMGPTP